MIGIQRSGAIIAIMEREVQSPSREVALNLTKCESVFFVDSEEEIATSTCSGFGKRNVGRPSFSTVFGCMRTMWAPLSIKPEIFTGNSSSGESMKHLHIKCLDLNG